ncbi:phage holin family protein [bacterium]|jgi:putative membrane protein|nr:phage holin family protein [Bacteroidia bacterium]MDC1519065.1 phage holin family protein [bacterium]
MKRIFKLLALGGVILLCGQYLDGVTISGGYKSALIAAIVLALVNSLVRPILTVLTFPATVFTFGLFSFVITALMVMLMDYFIGHIEISSFWWALLFGLIVSFAGSLIDKALNNEKRRPIQQREQKESSDFTNYEEVD